jgi:hypothetical protein
MGTALDGRFNSRVELCLSKRHAPCDLLVRLISAASRAIHGLQPLLPDHVPPLTCRSELAADEGTPWWLASSS